MKSDHAAVCPVELSTPFKKEELTLNLMFNTESDPVSDEKKQIKSCTVTVCQEWNSACLHCSPLYLSICPLLDQNLQ